jgi:cobyrinic acid a,c-diamide synthase
LNVVGAVANRIASARHEQLVRQALPEQFPFTALWRNAALALPERHLGLKLAQEIADLDTRLDQLADAIADTALAALPAPVSFAAPKTMPELARELDGVDIAVAFDEAFCFVYQANLEWLQRMGARLQFFSPLTDTGLPLADAVYLPGGYPELHASALAANQSMCQSIRDFVDAGGPLLAECGGMMYLADALVDFAGARHTLLELLPATATMGNKLSAIGSQEVSVDNETIRGHTFHYSTLATALTPCWTARTQDGRSGEAVFQIGALTASYLHWYFPSNPQLIAHWLRPRSL